MMINKWIVSLYVVIIWSNFCAAQTSNGTPASTNWGKAVQGVQLSIVATNSVVAAGSSITVWTVITNTSTNVVRLVESRAETDYDLMATNSAGARYPLTPRFIIGRRATVRLSPAKQYAISVPVSFPTTIEPGEYTLTASRGFESSVGNFELESNPLIIQVK
jgi:hypothetical protein